MPKVIQYRDRCIGCGVCFELQPHLWRMSKRDGKASMINSKRKKNVFIKNIPVADSANTIQTAAACPVKIIQVV
jgi:ferredoxin